MYRNFIKRALDIVLSLVAILVLSPVLLILTIVGAIAMGGNPFFTQARPGKKGRDGKEKIFKLVNFRTMNNKTDADGNLLPSKERLNKYGKILRATSLDELPELFNIFVGHMSVVGPRPLLVDYLPLYNKHQSRRHEVRPGLTGLAQVNGRNKLTWEEKFDLDVEYVSNITFCKDVSIIVQTVLSVLKREGITPEEGGINKRFTGTPEREVQS